MTYSLFSDITSRQLELRISKNQEMPRMSLSGMVQLSQLTFKHLKRTDDDRIRHDTPLPVLSIYN